MEESVVGVWENAHATLKVLKKKNVRDGYELLLVRGVHNNRRQDTVVKVTVLVLVLVLVLALVLALVLFVCFLVVLASGAWSYPVLPGPTRSARSYPV